MFLDKKVSLAGLPVVRQITKREIVDFRQQHSLQYSYCLKLRLQHKNTIKGNTLLCTDVQSNGVEDDTFHLIGEQLAIKRGGETFEPTIIYYPHSSFLIHTRAREGKGE